MGKAQLAAAQGDMLRSDSRSVAAVTRQRMAARGELDTDLVCAAGDQADADQRDVGAVIFAGGKAIITQDGFFHAFALTLDDVALVPRAVVIQRIAQFTAFIGHALTYGEVGLDQPAVTDIVAQDGGSLVIARKDHQALRRAVEAMNGIYLAAAEAAQDGGHIRTAVVRLTQHAVGLIGDENVFILKKDTLVHQNRPLITPSSLMSIRSAEGVFGRPGIVMMSPVRITMKPAPAHRWISLTWMTKFSGAHRSVASSEKLYCVLAIQIGRWL